MKYKTEDELRRSYFIETVSLLCTISHFHDALRFCFRLYKCETVKRSKIPTADKQILDKIFLHRQSSTTTTNLIRFIIKLSSKTKSKVLLKIINRH